MPEERPEFAFYYPNPVWHLGDWIKSLVLFFDGVALLVPSYMKDRPFEVDEPIAAGLHEKGLLQIIEPESFIDQKATQGLAEVMTNIIASGHLDKLASEPTAFHELSWSRLGYMADRELAEMIYDELKERGLAKPSEDGVSVPMHPLVRSLVLVLLAQILRPTGREHGLELSPATDNPRIHSALGELLELPSMASAGHVVSLDLETVGVDLSAVPLDEVLSFKAEHGDAYRAYMRGLRSFVRELGDQPDEEQAKLLDERREEIRDRARQLKEVAERSWKRPAASFALGLTGAAWRLHQGDIVGGLLALGSGIAGAKFSANQQTDAFSYLFRSGERFHPAY